MTESSQAHAELLALTADIVSSHFANNTVAAGDVPSIIQNVYATLAGLGAPVEAVVAKQEPAVSIRASIKPDYIVKDLNQAAEIILNENSRRARHRRSRA